MGELKFSRQSPLAAGLGWGGWVRGMPESSCRIQGIKWEHGWEQEAPSGQPAGLNPLGGGWLCTPSIRRCLRLCAQGRGETLLSERASLASWLLSLLPPPLDGGGAAPPCPQKSPFFPVPPHLAKAPKVPGGGIPLGIPVLRTGSPPHQVDLANTTTPKSVGSFGAAAPGRSSSSPPFTA